MDAAKENRVELINIGKSFGGIKALSDVTLKAHVGEIHALLGQNGAGKSTLMKVLAGAHQKDEGTIRIDGQEVIIRNPEHSRKLGIGIIYQEFSLVPDLTVAENVYFNSLGKQSVWMNRKKLNTAANELIQKLGFDINPSKTVRNLSVAQQQVVEIAKALSENVKVLILDEPSAVLAPHETQKLFEILGVLKSQGVTIVYISHRLEEIFQISDRITVIKDGATVKTVNTIDVDQKGLITLMIGRSLQALFPERRNTLGKEVLRVNRLTTQSITDISFSVKAGEVLGITGLVGSGRTETLEAIFGAYPALRPSEIFINGNRLIIKNPGTAVAAGIGFVSEDRKNKGVILDLSIRDNISITNLDSISSRLGFISRKREKKLTDELIRKMGIRTIDPKNNVGKLSGGNQQKVAFAKWLAKEGNLIIIDEPTRGVDVGAKFEIYSIINELTAKGYALLVVSSEMIEIMGISDRILVMKDGKAQGILEKEDFSEENILKLSIGNEKPQTLAV